MEKRINKKVVEYITGFKNDIKTKSAQLNINNTEQTTQLLQYIYDYERFALNKDDFAKRKRVKNVVPFFDRCSAQRANNEQCTRKKRKIANFAERIQKELLTGVSTLKPKQNQQRNQSRCGLKTFEVLSII